MAHWLQEKLQKASKNLGKITIWNRHSFFRKKKKKQNVCLEIGVCVCVYVVEMHWLKSHNIKKLEYWNLQLKYSRASVRVCDRIQNDNSTVVVVYKATNNNWKLYLRQCFTPLASFTVWSNYKACCTGKMLSSIFFNCCYVYLWTTKARIRRSKLQPDHGC